MSKGETKNAWQKANKEKTRQYAKDYYDKNRAAMNEKRKLARYGITPESYQVMYETQDGVCAICQKPETQKHASGAVKMLSVDHDHETNEVRGLLCNNCNRGLGFLGDDPENLERAARYLKGMIS